MAKKTLTAKQLDKLQSDAFNMIKAWLKYSEDLNDYATGVRNLTVPPGTPPPNPPGTK